MMYASHIRAALCASLCLCGASIVRADPHASASLDEEASAPRADREIDDDLVRDRLERAVRARMPWRDEDVALGGWRLPGGFSVPGGATRLRVRFDPRESFVGHVTAELEWLDPSGTAANRVRRSASVDVRVLRPVVMVTERIARGATIDLEALRVERRDTRRVPEDALRTVDQALGQRLRVAVRPGAPLLASYLDQEPVIDRGDLVAVDAGTGPLRIQLMARALAAGRLGDVIQLQNPTSRETFPARVTGPRTAVLALPGAAEGGVR
jgi:flagella basal body P-ring formation protein FlgA